MLAIVDYGVGNLRSLRNAFDHVGVDVEIVDEPGALASYSHVVLPGVGAFAKAMTNLIERGFLDPIRQHAGAGKPLLGICLGMQLLATNSLEFGLHEGLNLLPGSVHPLAPSSAFPVPHVGWNNLELLRKHPLFAKSGKRVVDYYFVHGFHFVPEDTADVIAKSDYGVSFCAVIGRKNVVGAQFHPEKSQAGGLALLEAFSEWDGAC